MRILEWIKSHPYEAAGSVVAVLTLYLLLRGGSSSGGGVDQASYYGAQASEVSANNQFAIAQLQANQQAQQTNAAASVENNKTGAELAAIQVQAHTTENVASINANSNEILAQLAAQTTQVISTLQATVAGKQIQADVDKTYLNDNALVTVALAPYMNLNAAQTAQLNALTGQVAGLQESTSENTQNIKSAVNYTRDLQSVLHAGTPLEIYNGANPAQGNYGYNITGL